MLDSPRGELNSHCSTRPGASWIRGCSTCPGASEASVVRRRSASRGATSCGAGTPRRRGAATPRRTPARPAGSRPASGPCRADRKSTRLNSSHVEISYAVFCLKKKKKYQQHLHENLEYLSIMIL